MAGRKTQAKAGIPEKRRGQQMGNERSDPSHSLEAERDTPALRGRRKEANKMFADKSYQETGSDAATPRDNTPSLPAAIPVGTPLGESGGEKSFKQRQKKRR